MRFAMTTDGMVKAVTVMVVVLVPLMVGLPLSLPNGVPLAMRGVTLGATLLGVGALVVTMLWAPRAARVDDAGLVIERLAWPDLVVPWAEVTSAEPGPALRAFGGEVWRVVGNGGLMGFTGLYGVRGVGVVRCWATRLKTPTVLVRRAGERALLLGVDDPTGLRAAINRHLGRT